MGFLTETKTLLTDTGPPIDLYVVDLAQPSQVTEPRATAKRRRVAARAALRAVLSRELRCSPAAVPLIAGPTGKPMLRDGSHGLHFNLSRSGDCCLIALTRAGPLGIDVERVARFQGLERIVQARFSPDEAAEILELEGEERLRAFYRRWTRKEAILKARGAGIDQLEDVLAGDDSEAWTVRTVDAGSEFAAALACRTGVGAGIRRLQPVP